MQARVMPENKKKSLFVAETFPAFIEVFGEGGDLCFVMYEDWLKKLGVTDPLRAELLKVTGPVASLFSTDQSLFAKQSNFKRDVGKFAKLTRPTRIIRRGAHSLRAYRKKNKPLFSKKVRRDRPPEHDIWEPF